MRTIILHYHLFKNAGTSLDRILKENFGPRWVTKEFPMSGNDNSDQVTDWIHQNPDAVAFSSHTMVGPLPRPAGVTVVPIMLLRDPVARIRSAYRFERNQQADTWGAQLAKDHDFDGYVRARLDRPGDRQCRNFQTSRLASLIPGRASEKDRALDAARQLHIAGTIGLVSQFSGALSELQHRIKPVFPDFDFRIVRENVSNSDADNEDHALDALLKQSNLDDLCLLEAVEAWT